MKFSIIVAALGFASASAPATSPQELSAFVGKLRELVQPSMDLASNTEYCLLDIFSSDTVKATRACPQGLEAAGNECYEPCKAGYRSWYQFCMPLKYNGIIEQTQTALLLPYKRDAVKIEATCPASALMLGDGCFMASCPSKLPFQCGFACTKDAFKCVDLVKDVVALLIDLVVKIQTGDLTGAFFALKNIYDFVQSLGFCDKEFASTIVSEVVAIIGM